MNYDIAIDIVYFNLYTNMESLFIQPFYLQPNILVQKMCTMKPGDISLIFLVICMTIL